MKSKAFVTWLGEHWYPLTLTVIVVAVMLATGRYVHAAGFLGSCVVGAVLGRLTP